MKSADGAGYAVRTMNMNRHIRLSCWPQENPVVNKTGQINPGDDNQHNKRGQRLQY